MLGVWSVSILAVCYVCLLFAVACLGERYAPRLRRRGWDSPIYALSLAVWCTSWAFYGVVGHAAWSGFGFALTYVGPALMLLLAYPVLQKIAYTAKAHHVTSIADFIGARYGKSHAVAALVTALAVVGIIPFIALQLQAITITFNWLAFNSSAVDTSPVNPMAAWATVASASPLPLWRDTALHVSLGMALFAILFGLRRVHSNERHPGMIVAIAFESLIKLVAFLALGLFVTFSLFPGPAELAAKVSAIPPLADHLTAIRLQPHWITIAFLAGLAFICLPRQFHVAIVENGRPANLRAAVWVFPLYLVAIALFVPAIAAAGLLTLPRGTVPDLFTLLLPLKNGHPGLALAVFIGGLSAATGAIIVEVVALSTMICNELVVPLLLRGAALRDGARPDMTRLLLGTRWAAAFFVLLAAYAFHKTTAHTYSLASIGLISLVAVAQFAPALLVGLYWRGAHRHGVLAGLVGGSLVWAYGMLLPSLPGATWPGRTGTQTTAVWPSIWGTDPLTTIVAASLLINLALLVIVSLAARRSESDRLQADAFVAGKAPAEPDRAARAVRAPSYVELKTLAERLVGTERATRAFGGPIETYNDKDLAAHTERVLSGAIGAASAHIMVAAVLRRHRNPIGPTRSILAEASEAILFNHDLLRATLENVTQGIGMFDAQGRLAAWNQRFLEMLGIPETQAQIGTPLPLVLGECESAGVDAASFVSGPEESGVSAALQTRELKLPDGRVFEMQKNPIQAGGFVLVCTDITAQIQTLEALRRSERQIREANEMLEQRVAERTRELTLVNEQLAEATRAAEASNVGKTRFFASASHDLLQPLHVARILTGALSERNRAGKTSALLGQLDRALGAVDELLQTLLDISKLDTGAVRPQLQPIELHKLITGVAASFQPMAAQRGLRLRVLPSRAIVQSDPMLLRRILQNFLSNALRYTRRGTVLIGCRRRADRVLIEVWDSGVGIPQDQLPLMFEEFRRGGGNDAETPPGLGLGLAIVDRIARMLQHPVIVRSWPEKGSVFAVSVPVSTELPAPQLARVEDRPRGSLAGKLVLCVDNDPAALVAMRTLLQGWACEVLTATDAMSACAEIERRGAWPDIVLMDYHLDGDMTGLDALEALTSRTARELPAILITANYTDTVRVAADTLGYAVLNKPVRPGALRALMAQMLSRHGAAHFESAAAS